LSDAVACIATVPVMLGPVGATRFTVGLATSAQLAPTVLSASIVSVQVLAVPEQSPLQLWNDHPLGVEAFSVTSW
jgi:hypothetical protein